MTMRHATAALDSEPSSAPSVAANAAASADRLRIAVVIATTGRPTTSRRMIDRLARQTRLADRVLVVAVTPADIIEMDRAVIPVEVHLGPRGLCHQRNHGLRLLAEAADLVAFFDDDFLPADDYLARAEQLFLEQPDVIGATGRVIADGVHGPGISFEAAEALLASAASAAPTSAAPRPKRALYGCNMIYRFGAIGDMRFDEALPLYAWQEDIDFSYRLSRRGRLVEDPALAGVHMGEKSGRQSGRRLGYSQIANPVYLLGKQSIPRDLAFRIMRNNVASNLWRSLAPEPHIDRRGRLAGNLRALWDLATRRLHPGRILEFK